MSRAKIGSVGILLVAAMAIAVHGPAFAGGPANQPSGGNLLGALAGTQLSSREMGAARGGTAVLINNGTESLNDVGNSYSASLNESASSGGSVSGSVSGAVSGAASSVITGNSGFVNAFSNTGNNVMMNSSTSIFINSTP